MARSTWETWAKRVERWTDSGLTAAEFAKETGINPRTLVFWKWRLTRDNAEQSKPATPVFVEVRTVPPMTVEPIEVIVRKELRIRVPAQFDAEVLRRVVAALEAR